VFGIQTSKSEGVDGRSVEMWYRDGRHRDIADYCLEDVRATMQLYDRIAPTLLMFNKEFRESEERELRVLRKETPALLPSNESAFMEAVAQTSRALTASLDVGDEPMAEGPTAATTQAIVFEKLIKAEQAADDDLELGS
jgi:hypothetical protein